MVMLVDPSLKNHKMQVKVLQMAHTFLEGMTTFAEINTKFLVDNFNATGLDMVFFGQENFDT
jgi:hypothetical protein